MRPHSLRLSRLTDDDLWRVETMKTTRTKTVRSISDLAKRHYEAVRSLVGRDYTRISEYERTRYGKKETVSEHFKQGIRAKHVLYGWGIMNPAHEDKQGMVEFVPKGGEVLCVGRPALMFA
jgi:hypothetical protein